MKIVTSGLWPFYAQSSRVGSDGTATSMNSRLNTLETSLDEHIQFSGNTNKIDKLPHHKSCESESGCLDHQNCKMPGLLRLNSIGEDSTVDHCPRNQSNSGQNRGANPVRISFSSSRSKPRYFPSMTSVKTLTQSNMNCSGPLMSGSAAMISKSNSCPAPDVGQSRFSTAGFPPHHLGGRTSQLSSFCTAYNKQGLRKSYSSPACMFQTFGPGSSLVEKIVHSNSFNQTGQWTNSLCPLEMPAQFRDSRKNGNNSIHSVVKEMLRVPGDTVTPVREMPTQENQHLASAIPTKPVDSIAETLSKDDSLCQMVKQASAMSSSAGKESSCDNQMNKSNSLLSDQSAVILPTADSKTKLDACHFLSQCEDQCIDWETLPYLNENSSHLSADDCEAGESAPKRSDASDGEQDKKSVSGVDSQSSLSSSASPSAVLLLPRKTVKKGRPSSKKQKKRQREKRKQTSNQPSEHSTSDESSTVKFCDAAFSVSDESTLSEPTPPPHSHPKVSTPVKPQSSHTAFACLFISPSSDCEDTDDVSDDDSDWSSDTSTETYIAPITGGNFNVAINLDSIFKKKNIPSLESVLSTEESESDAERLTPGSSYGAGNHLCLKFSLSLSDDESIEDSIEFCPSSSQSPSSSEHAMVGFTRGLCMDSLFPKKSNLKAEKVPGTALELDHGDCCSITESCSHAFDPERSQEMMKDINAKWDKIYPSAGFRSCDPQLCNSQVDNSAVKVRFASDHNLVTIHEVGTEERGGIWQQFAVDRERFERRIQDVERILTPVLAHAHRNKIQECLDKLRLRLDS